MYKQILHLLNVEYSRIEKKTKDLENALTLNDFNAKCGWYNGHYRAEGKKWIREAYPVSVIEVCGICDIEIGFYDVSVSTKLKREKALEYSFEKLTGYPFEAYGANDYLTNLYESGQPLPVLKENIENCSECEICFSFVFPFNIGGSTICKLIALLRNDYFYI